MSKSPVRVGMLGAGFIGQMHSLALRMAGAARQEPRVTPQLALLVDRDEALGRDVAERYDWARLSGDVEALAQEPLDLFVNAGPNDAHVETTAALAQRGVHVFCEKPLARTAGEALELWRAVRDTGVQHRCAFIHRFIPSLRVARDMIAAGELGEVRHVRAQFLLDMLEPDGSLSWRFDRARAGTGALGDLGSHHIDVARFLVGEVVEVSGVMGTWTTDPRSEIEVNDDAFACTALLENGAMATFEASRVAAGHSLTGRVEVDGTEGSLAFDMERLNELVIRAPRRGPRVQSIPRAGDAYDGFWLPGGIQGSHPVGWHQCFAHQAHDVLGLAAGVLEESVAATFEDGYRVAEIVDAIEDAARARAWRAVRFRS
jgi:predicted dehydrogenase